MREAIPPVEPSKQIPLADFELDFDNIWLSRLDALIFPHLLSTGHQRIQLQRLAEQYLSQRPENADFEVDSLSIHMEQIQRDIVDRLDEKQQHPIIGRYLADYLLLVLHQLLYAIITDLRFDSRLNLVSKNLEKVAQTLITAILDNTKDFDQPIHSDQLYLIKGYLRQIQDQQQLNRSDTIAMTVEIASQFEQLAKYLGVEALGMAMKIQQLYESGVLELEQAQLLQSFTTKIRNPVVHSSYTLKSSDLKLIFETGQLVLQLLQQYHSLDQNLSPGFQIS